MSVDNTSHTLDFAITFTVPDGLTASVLTNNRNWFTNFTLKLSAQNRYTSAATLGTSSTTGSGSGNAKLQNVSLAAGASSSEILLYFSGYTWQTPVYNINGNTLTIALKKSYTNVKVASTNYKYYTTATIYLILPNQNPTPTPSPTPTPTPTPSPTPTYTPTPTPSPTPTPTPTPSPTPTPTLTPTPSFSPVPTDSPIPTDLPAPTDSPTSTPDSIPPTSSP
jgi:hypothetical protein